MVQYLNKSRRVVTAAGLVIDLASSTDLYIANNPSIATIPLTDEHRAVYVAMGLMGFLVTGLCLRARRYLE